MTDVTTANLAQETAAVKDAVGAALATVSTTAALAAVGNAINTTGKYKGKQVFNETTGILVIAADGLPASVWKLCSTGATTHTPV
jgi:hypothetical protein